jgi:hypothetical protein
MHLTVVPCGTVVAATSGLAACLPSMDVSERARLHLTTQRGNGGARLSNGRRPGQRQTTSPLRQQERRCKHAVAAFAAGLNVHGQHCGWTPAKHLHDEQMQAEVQLCYRPLPARDGLLMVVPPFIAAAAQEVQSALA